MDKIINFLLLIICIVIIFTFLFNKETLERFGFSDIDKAQYHDLDKRQRKMYNIFLEDYNLVLDNPKLNNTLRDVNELMNYDCKGKDIYEMTSINKDRNFVNNLDFW